MNTSKFIENNTSQHPHGRIDEIMNEPKEPETPLTDAYFSRRNQTTNLWLTEDLIFARSLELKLQVAERDQLITSQHIVPQSHCPSPETVSLVAELRDRVGAGLIDLQEVIIALAKHGCDKERERDEAKKWMSGEEYQSDFQTAKEMRLAVNGYRINIADLQAERDQLIKVVDDLQKDNDRLREILAMQHLDKNKRADRQVKPSA